MPRKKLTGKVVSNKMQKTVVVKVVRLKEHSKYKRRIRVYKKYKAHYTKGEYNVGDEVIIEECRPISKEKRWRVIKKLTPQIKKESGQVAKILHEDGTLDNLPQVSAPSEENPERKKEERK